MIKHTPIPRRVPPQNFLASKSIWPQKIVSTLPTNMEGHNIRAIARAAACKGVFLDATGTWTPFEREIEVDDISSALGTSYIIEAIPGFPSKRAKTHILVANAAEDTHDKNELASWIMAKEMYGHIIWCPIRIK